MNIETTTNRLLAYTDGSTGHLIFNNPPRHNALSLEMWSGIAYVTEQFEANDNIRAVVMSGAGGKAFVSGADISEFNKVRNNAAQEETYGQASARGAHALRTMSKPLIAKVTGYCIGGGLATALNADVRFATPDSTFGIPAAKLGLGYDYEGLAKLSRICGPARARDILFSARFLNAQEAYDAGIVQFIVERDEIDSEVESYCERIGRNAPLTIRAAKSAVNAYEQGGQERDIAIVRSQIKDCFDSNDYKEGRQAFAEKRTPNFSGS